MVNTLQGYCRVSLMLLIPSNSNAKQLMIIPSNADTTLILTKLMLRSSIANTIANTLHLKNKKMSTNSPRDSIGVLGTMDMN